jgi:hypothetical protein
VSKLEHLVEQLDEVKAEIKATERRIADCQYRLGDLKNQERDLRRKIEREAHLYL